jgi:hypothetical protein
MPNFEAIHDSATRNKGMYVPFSQDVEPTRTLIRSMPYTAKGICEALAAKWIVEHANGSSLWNWLLEKETNSGSVWNWLFGKGERKINESAIINLMINHTEGKIRDGSLANPTTKDANVAGSAAYQMLLTHKYLKQYGLRSHAATDYENADNRFQVGLALPAALNLRDFKTTYVLISLAGEIVGLEGPKQVGHAAAAYVGEDVAFFDPSFGEYWFPSHHDFAKFFGDFWKESKYGEIYDSFTVNAYVK